MRIYPKRALNFVDRTGIKYGRWIALELGPKPKGCKRSFWICRCECGNQRSVSGADLSSGKSQSCGCLQIEATIARGKHFEASRGKTTAEYRAWMNMKTRCLNPNHDCYHCYGGRGIVICERWMNSFENFLADMGRRPSSTHSLERNNTNGNYEPSNCKWATKLEQGNNTRRNHFLEFGGRIQTISQWTRELGFGSSLICVRLSKGWSVERALTTPVKVTK